MAIRSSIAVAVVLVTLSFAPSAPRAEPRRGQVWEPGFVSADGTAVPGFWRPIERDGFEWIEGRWDGAFWVRPYWKPERRRGSFIWVTGSPGPSGWIHGYWRLPYYPDEPGWIDHRPIRTPQVIVIDCDQSGKSP